MLAMEREDEKQKSIGIAPIVSEYALLLRMISLWISCQAIHEFWFPFFPPPVYGAQVKHSTFNWRLAPANTFYIINLFRTISCKVL